MYIRNSHIRTSFSLYFLQLADRNCIIVKRKFLLLPQRQKAFLNHASNAWFSLYKKAFTFMFCESLLLILLSYLLQAQMHFHQFLISFLLLDLILREKTHKIALVFLHLYKFPFLKKTSRLCVFLPSMLLQFFPNFLKQSIHHGKKKRPLPLY